MDIVSITGDEFMCTLLVASGADISVRNRQMRTALDIARLREADPRKGAKLAKVPQRCCTPVPVFLYPISMYCCPVVLLSCCLVVLLLRL